MQHLSNQKYKYNTSVTKNINAMPMESKISQQHFCYQKKKNCHTSEVKNKVETPLQPKRFATTLQQNKIQHLCF